MTKLTFTFFLSLFATIVSAQTDGYWDKDRATSREIIVPAGNRVVIKTEDFPVGTTEVVYRITILDENQQLANSLVSLLKSIPDPSGISQGSAGAIFILSKVSGDDKCRYGIFTTSENAQKYRETGKPEKACLYQDTPINKEVKVLSAEKMACLNPGSTNLWFAFESNNWILKQKIVLEVVPWVDNKMSRGWTSENKKSVISLCKTSDLAKRIPDADDFCICILDKFQKDYKFPEYNKMLAAEKAKAFKDYGKTCLNETDASGEIYKALRDQAAEFIKQGQFGDAIAKLQVVINENKANAADYNAIGYSFLLTRQYEKALKFLKEGEKLDPSELQIKLNLAHAHLLNGDYSTAKKIYKKYKAQNVTDALAWKEKVKLDFEAFKKAGIASEDFEAILNSLK
ncbi:tetratricopeptide repeat protein [Flavobacterium sp.]|uniref:tetratricopeptide repeat protein n=1 Tax=Flavobacterium sp. TaxID=239 RepID=UPI0039E2822E